MIGQTLGALPRLIKAIGFREAIILILLGAVVGIITGYLPNQLNEVGAIKTAIAAHVRQEQEQVRLLKLICLFTAQRAGAQAMACVSPTSEP